MFTSGEVVAGFTIDAVVGHGSSADVYRVHRDDEATPLALKVLRTDLHGLEHARERFEHEFAIASLLHHPNIVAMDSSGEVALGDQRHPRHTALWLAMQYVAGPSAIYLIPRYDQQPQVSAVLRVAQQIGAALDYAHSKDILHRDVKPANILLTTTDDTTDALLTDFGIARFLDDTRPLARNGRVQGSVAYAAPELLQAQQLSPATDVYAFACSLIELFTGLPPYPRTTPFAITYAHIRDQPPKLTARREWLPSSLNSVFAKALAKNPADRYQTCGEFVEIITRALRDVPVPVGPTRRRGWLR
ncbi:serine/threonine-protein kinase [Gordonia sp. VNQ95]|jgi:serine/threonine-protein kinase|uniref:serine/threonine-protein kinase n=1 Tax=Gordonia sp. VNQ95 TaxID=3156619 RepID=UPI0032B40BC5